MSHIGRPYTFTALGKDWTMARFSFTIWEDLVAAAKTIIPDPRQEAADLLKAVPEMDMESKIRIVHEANNRAVSMFELGSGEMLKWMTTPSGVIRTVHALLKPNHPDVTLDTACDIVKSESVNFDDAFAVVSGSVPEKKDNPGD